jgi:hypothetical protein
MNLNSEDFSTKIRKMKMVFSPFAPEGVEQYIIDKNGVRGILE